MASAGSTVSLRNLTVSDSLSASNASVSNLAVYESLSASNVNIESLPSSILGSVSVLGQPSYVTSGYGYIWVITVDTGKVYYIDPGTKVATAISGNFPDPSGITSGYGYIWVASTDADGYEIISYIDPGTKVVTQIPGNPFSDLDIIDITVGYGYIWVTTVDQDDFGKVYYIDPGTKVATAISDNFPYPSGIITSGYGYIWVAFASFGQDDGNVYYIDPVTKVATAVSGDYAGPDSITAGYGYIWVTYGDQQLLRIKPDGTEPTVVTGITTDYITSGYGYLWCILGATISVIDPVTNNVVQTINVTGPAPFSIYPGYGYMWIMTSGAVSYIKIGTLTSQDTTTGKLEVSENATFNGDVEIVNSSLAITGRGVLTCDRINTNIFSVSNIVASNLTTTNLFASNITASNIYVSNLAVSTNFSCTKLKRPTVYLGSSTSYAPPTTESGSIFTYQLEYVPNIYRYVFYAVTSVITPATIILQFQITKAPSKCSYVPSITFMPTVDTAPLDSGITYEYVYDNGIYTIRISNYNIVDSNRIVRFMVTVELYLEDQ